MCDWTKIYHDEDEEFRWRRVRGKDLDDEALSGPNGDRHVVNRPSDDYTGVKSSIGSKVPCFFCFEICIQGRKGSANFIRKHTE